MRSRGGRPLSEGRLGGAHGGAHGGAKGGATAFALAGLALAGLLGCATASAERSESVRVLIYNDEDPVQVGALGGTRTVSLGDSGLLVGNQAVGPRWTPSGEGPWQVGQRQVRGRIALRAESGRIQVLNRVGLEDYVASTVGGEMSPSWPEEALRAQAVAARTYVLHEASKRVRSDWDVRATAASQVYRGIAAESRQTVSAARATRGEVLTYRGEPILAVFHSTAGGRTAAAGEVWGRDLPYLQVIEVDEEDEAPHTYWRTQFSAEGLSEILRANGVEVGELVGLSVVRRTASGRVARLEVRGNAGRETMRGARLRTFVSTLGLRSTLFDVRSTAEGYAFVGSGYGHGVGMSQWGARILAERGASYQRILARFYPGTRIERWSSRRIAAPMWKDSESASGRRGGEAR